MDVLLQVRGQVVPVGSPILVHDLSRTGFGVVSRIPFAPGQTLSFRLTVTGEAPVLVAARAVHARPLPGKAGMHLTGFEFVPGRLTGVVPQPLIDRLLEAVSGPPVPAL